MIVAIFIISITSLMLSIWGLLNIMFITKTLDMIADILNMHHMADKIRRGEPLTSEQEADLERILNE